MDDTPRAVNYVEMLTRVDKRDSIASDDLSACEREVLRLMRETVKRQRGRATFVVEFIGSAWHVLECSPPRHIKL